MKGKILIEAISEDRVAAVADREGWAADGNRHGGISVNVGITATGSEAVEIVYALIKALDFSGMQIAALFMRLMGADDTKRVNYSMKGPMHGTSAKPGEDPPPLL